MKDEVSAAWERLVEALFELTKEELESALPKLHTWLDELPELFDRAEQE